MATRYAAPVNDEIERTDEQRERAAALQRATELQLAFLAAEDALQDALDARNAYLRELYARGIYPTEIGSAVPRRSGEPTGRTEIARIVRYRPERAGIKRPRAR
jgi:hypothetical protein